MLNGLGVRSSVFLDPDTSWLQSAKEIGANRVELYTGIYASSYKHNQKRAILEKYKDMASMAQKLGLGVNAGHDLNLTNLKDFLSIGHILGVP